MHDETIDVLRPRRASVTERNSISAAEAFRQLEADAQLLKAIREAYSPESREFDAMRRAAMALAYVVMHDREKFATFMQEMDRDLTDEQRDELRNRYGIETG